MLRKRSLKIEIYNASNVKLNQTRQRTEAVMILFTKSSNFTLCTHFCNQSTDVQAHSSIFTWCCLRPYVMKNGNPNQYHLFATHTKINTRALQKEKLRPSKANLHNNWEEPDVDEGDEANHDVDEDARYTQQVIEEVELMLTPEERAILQKNKVPDFKQLASDGASLLHYAVLVHAIQTLKLLIKNNIDVNVADNEGWTPLHLAVQSRVRDVAKILLLNGADKTIKNKDGNTPFDVAISLGKGFKTYEMTKLLKLVPAAQL